METQKPKIGMYVKRSFGEKFSASFDFIKEHWKLLLKYTTYLLLPLCLIQALGLNGLSGMMEMSDMNSSVMPTEVNLMMSFWGYYGLYMLCVIVGSVLLASLVYALIRTYNEREERLQGITLGMLRPLLLRNVKRMFVLFLFTLLLLMLVMFVIVALAVVALPSATLSSVVLFFIILLFIACIIPLLLWAPVYLFEDITVYDAFKKAFRLGFATWGGVFLIYLLMGLIGGILAGVSLMPWRIVTMVKAIFADSGGSEATVSFGYSFATYLLAIIQAFSVYLSMIFVYVGLAYQYGHASEKLDNVMVESDIDNFDKL
ncbi:hypothetical protein [Bacteroides sp. UBA939]|uniref:hypothetical protein n=1 Tax=Bacteroides sp. UBA939 TaxID=1946092 RepID=UPI0025B825C9|nr:hypothetical protein [Bacteroides sp. UBA939]